MLLYIKSEMFTYWCSSTCKRAPLKSSFIVKGKMYPYWCSSTCKRASLKCYYIVKMYPYWCSSTYKRASLKCCSSVICKMYPYWCFSSFKRVPLKCCFIVKDKIYLNCALQPVKELLSPNISEWRRADFLNIHEPCSSAPLSLSFFSFF